MATSASPTRFSTASRISRAVSTLITVAPPGAATDEGPVTRVTSAPRSQAARARAAPIFPEERLPRYRTASTGSRVPAAVTRTRFPASAPPPPSARPTASTISAGSAIRPGPLPSPAARGPSAGPTRSYFRASFSRARLLRVMGCANMRSFMAGATTTGAPVATITVVSRSLARPLAARAMKSAVAGATQTQSAPRPSEMCSAAPPAAKMSTRGPLPVTPSNDRGATNLRAERVRTTSTSAPRSVRSRATWTAL